MIFGLQKASALKRISAFILDVILLCIVAVGFAFLVSIICDYSTHIDTINEYYTQYEDFEKLVRDNVTFAEGEEGQKQFNDFLMGISTSPDDSAALSNLSAEARAYHDAYYATYGEGYKALPEVAKVNNLVILIYSITLLMAVIGFLLAYIALEIIVPLILKNGQTVGKKIFGIALVRPDCVKMSTFSLFVRTILGKYTIETMVPVFLVCMTIFLQAGIIPVVVIGALIILNLCLFIFTKDRTMIHDLFAATVAVDLASQKIFNSTEEVIEYKKLLHAEEVEKKPY